MPKQLTVTAYSFDELSEEAKDKARDKFREHALQYDWWDTIYEDADSLATLMGIDIDRKKGSATEPAIEFSGFACQGDGASFTGQWSHKTTGPKDGPKDVRDHAPLDEKLHAIADELDRLGWALGPNVRATISRIDNHYSHDCTVRVDLEDTEDEDREIDEDTRKAVQDALRSFMRWIYKQLEAEYDYRMSNEAIDEDIEANEYLFTAEGSRTTVLND